MTDTNSLSLQAAALNRPAQRQPTRRAGSIRRTSSLQSLWDPDHSDAYQIVGRSLDLLTAADCAANVVGEDAINAKIGIDGRLAALNGSRLDQQLAQFAGLRPGGELRKAMARDIEAEVQHDTRLHRLLDDLAGATFMAVASWYAWEGGIPAYARRTGNMDPTTRPVEGVCLSYVPGSPSMTEDGFSIDDNADHPLGPLPLGVDDQQGFHALVDSAGPNQWRLRRTDVWHENGNLNVDAWFQDSSGIPGEPGRRVIFHEYSLTARIDVPSQQLIAIEVTPHVLPYVTCHAAPATAHALIGRDVRELRGLVPLLLKGTAGCTHLNDMLRALQDVAALAGMLKSPG